MQSLILGVDIGATKTHLILATNQGKIITEKHDLGANLHITSPAQIISQLNTLVNQVFSQPSSASNINQVCIGLAGLDTLIDKHRLLAYFNSQPVLAPQLAHASMLIVNDAFIGLRSGTNATPAICLIAGTGSNCYGIDVRLREVKAGDWGYLLGDSFSSFSIGQKLLKLVLKQYDGRLIASSLTNLVLDKLELKSVEALIDWAYSHAQVPVRSIASLAQLLTHKELSGLPELIQIRQEFAQEASQALSAVAQKLHKHPNEKLPVVIIGGLMQQEELRLQLLEQLASDCPWAQCLIPSHPPVYGALAIAQNYERTQLPPTSLIL